MIDTKVLREKILDLAIRGKLVPQDPNDEPASVLLKKIREQKKQMVKEDKLKAKDIKNDTVIFKGDDNLHYEQFADGTVKCIEDEIPFEVPDGWCWCRLGSISAAIQYGLSNSAEQSGTHRLLRITDIQDGKVDWDTVPFTTAYEAGNYLLSSGDIVFARTGATVGKSFLIKELPYPAVYASYLIRIRLLDGVHPDYIYQFFSSQCYWEQITDKSVGVGQPNCNGTSLKELFIPIPPFSEQNRIVPSALSTLEYVTNIELDKASLLETVTSIKFKILDLAIQGKLVPQNQDDEPASVLLERIRAEKEELIKAGKIKRDKKESVIFKGDDNSYYENLPSNWALTSLGMISKVITKGTTPRGGNVSYTSSGIGFLRAENILGYDKLNLDNLKYVDDKTHTGFLKRSILESNDILITIAGTLGRTAIVTESALPLNTNQAVALVRPVTTKFVNIKYLIYAINSSKIKKDLLHQEVAMAIPNLSLENIYDCKIPLPPIEEQNRISEVIEKIFVVFDIIEQSLN